MKKEYDFSQAEQGKFYRPIEELELPIYLDKKVRTFYEKRAQQKHVELETIINSILKKEMEIVKEVEA